jgi:hypothetical protein
VGNRQSLVSTLAALTNQSSTYDADDRLLADTYDANCGFSRNRSLILL